MSPQQRPKDSLGTWPDNPVGVKSQVAVSDLYQGAQNIMIHHDGQDSCTYRPRGAVLACREWTAVILPGACRATLICSGQSCLPACRPGYSALPSRLSRAWPVSPAFSPQGSVPLWLLYTMLLSAVTVPKHHDLCLNTFVISCKHLELAVFANCCHNLLLQ